MADSSHTLQGLHPDLLRVMLFYAFREFFQWRRRLDGWFDRAGFLWGVAPMTILWIVLVWAGT